MDSPGKLLSLTNHRTFSERLLARVDHVVCAKIEQNRLFLCVETRGMVPEELLLTLCCSALDPKYARTVRTRVETAVRHGENHYFLKTSPLEPPTDYRGELPNSAAVFLEKDKAEKTYILPGANSATKPQP